MLFNLMGTDPDGLNGRYLGDSSDLVRYFLSKHPEGGNFTVPLTELAKDYVVIGKRFGIRADMAWAQMIHETGFWPVRRLGAACAETTSPGSARPVRECRVTASRRRSWA